MHYTEQFGRLKIYLNHRLVRKLIKEIDKIPKDELKTRPVLMSLRKYLTKLWRHPNYRRFNGGHKIPVIDKRIQERRIYIGGGGHICLDRCNAVRVKTIDKNCGLSPINFITLLSKEKLPF